MPGSGAHTTTVLGGRYRVVQALKQGQGIDTLLGVDLAGGTQVVIKTASAETVSPAAQMRLEHEAAVLGRIASPSFCPLLEFGREDGSLYLVMPHVPGIPLAERLRDGHLTVRDAITVARCILLGLGEAHDHGVLHRDVKPPNVIVNEGAPIKRATLIDFGLARSSRLDASIRDQPVGTARYISPEQAGLLELDVDERSDLYSLGILLFECLAGRPPFEGGTVGEVLRQHLTAAPPELRSLNQAVPRSVEEVVQRLIRKDPRDRYQSTEAVVGDLDEIADALDRGIEDPPVVVGLRDRRHTLTEPAFVGRAEELDHLERALELAGEGFGELVLLEAPSGEGKTRLLDEFAHRSGPKGAWVLWGQGLDQAAQRPFQLLAGVAIGLLRAARTDPELLDGIRDRLGEQRDAVYDVLPELADTLGPRTTAALGPEAHGEARSIAALASLLGALGSPERPALVLLDDCQWADDPTIRLIRHWWQTGRGVDDRHVLVVAAFRSDEVADEHVLRGMRPSSHLALDPLSTSDVRALVESMAGSLPDDVLDVVGQLAGGSPFMASAILRGLVESGALRHDPDGWHMDEVHLEDIRSSRQAAAVLQRRFRLLPPEALRLLRVGAVLGKEFELDLAATLAEQSAVEAVAALNEARRRKIVWSRRSEARVAFVHDKLRETLLEMLDDEDLKALHRAAAAHLAAEDPGRVFDLAYHLDAADEIDRALPYALEAGRRARAQHSLEIAERQYRVALRGARHVQTEVRREIAEGLGDVLMLRGDYEEASAWLGEAASLTPEGAARARVEAKLSELAFKRGELGTSRDAAEGALRRLGQRVPRRGVGYLLAAAKEIVVHVLHSLFPGPFCGRRSLAGGEEDLLAVRLYSRLAHVYWFSAGSVPTLWAHLREMNLAERYPSTAELAQAYSEHAPVMTLLPWYSRGVAFAERSYRIREDREDVWGQGQSLNFWGITLYNASRYEECIEKCRRAARLLERTGDRWELNIARLHIAFAQYRLGQLGVALEEARRLHASGLEIGDPQASGIGVEIWAKVTEGQVPEGLVGAELARETMDVQLRAHVMQAEAVRLLGAGRPEEAADVLSEAADTVRRAGLRNEYVAPVWAWLATAHRASFEGTSVLAPSRRRALRRKARRAARKAHRLARFYRNNLPHVLRERALLAVIDGSPSKARKLIDSSLRVATEQDARYEYARSLLVRGRIGLEHAWPGAADDAATAEAKLRVLEVVEDPVVPSSSDGATLSLVDRFSTILDAGRTIAAALSRDAIYSAVREASMQLLRGERCVVLRVDEAPDGDVDLTLVSGEIDAGYSRTLARRAIERRMPVSFSEDDADDSTESIELNRIRSGLCAPIFVRGRTSACFSVTHQQVGGLFGETEERLAEFIATLAGAALENAEGFAEVQALTRTLERRVAERTAELEKSNRALRAAYDREREVVRKLRELDELKSDFLSTVSHELRTPLTAIGGFGHTLVEHWERIEESMRRDLAARISQNAGELDTLIGELLDFSRLERGHLKLEPQPCDVRASVERSVSKLQTVLARHEVDVDVPDGTIAMADENAYSRAVENLLTNAAKFSPPGSRIRISGKIRDDEVVVSVADEGIGIPPEEVGRVFERFYRIERGDHATTGGTGIGLAIVKQFVEAQGGRVWVESEPGTGSTFSFALARADLDISTPAEDGASRIRDGS